jgi:Zn2+/Cd2+-exporting ATPase
VTFQTPPGVADAEAKPLSSGSNPPALAAARADSGAIARVRTVCVTCARGSRAFVGHYREFLREPGTLVTLISLVLLVVAMSVDFGGLVGSGATGGLHHPLYLCAAVIGSLWIWWSAFQGILHRDFTADIPVSIATAAALAIGQYAAAAVVAVLLLIGGLLEAFVAARAGRAMEALATLLPDHVTVRRGGVELEVSLEDVVVDDLLIIRPGERIAVDGVVQWGTAAVNQAVITGESVPVEKELGDLVFAGTLNESGGLEVLATKVGAETTLGQIRRMVSEAENRKAPIERLLDRYAKFYTPVALILGGVLWWWSGDILRAITVLIVFCPCVMVLATPTALVAAIGNAALRGSLVKQGSTVEALARINTVAFDKTGTLTHGKPDLVAVIPTGDNRESEVTMLAASAEKFSEHPIARAIQAAAQRQEILVPDPDEFVALPGLGVRAMIGGRQILIGRPALLAESGVEVPLPIVAASETEAALGRTVVLLARDSAVMGMLVFADTARSEAASTVSQLTGLGVATILISGDNQRVAARLATDLGIPEVHAEVMPAEKVAIVEREQARGRAVAFVGDGVNDGPALAIADVGVAMGIAGTDVAIETAEIALLSDDLSKLPHLFNLSRRALRAIKQNLVFSLGVLAIAVGLTIPGILHPVTGALLHELSSIPVIMNSARLINLKAVSGRDTTGVVPV